MFWNYKYIYNKIAETFIFMLDNKILNKIDQYCFILRNVAKAKSNYFKRNN